MAVTKEQIIEFLKEYIDLIHENKDYLTDLDQQIGDGDHGINMNRGLKAVEKKLEKYDEKKIGEILKDVGFTLVNNVGGASGPLYGTAFMNAGTDIEDTKELENQDIINMLQSMIDGIKLRGKAEKGDKTILDALIPAKIAFEEAIENDESTVSALKKAKDAAYEGVEYTKTIPAKKGRASYLGERSIGVQDPGATSTALMFQALFNVLENKAKEEDEDDENVGIVIVSHSPKIGEGVKELALEMAPDAKIAVAAGTKKGNIGTDLKTISKAIKEVYSPAGVVILIDIGSALMTTQMAVETFKNVDNIEIMDAPLVEGAVFAAIESTVGSDIEKIKEVLQKTKSESKF